MTRRMVPISDAAYLNPRYSASTAKGCNTVAFLPMSGVSERGFIESAEERSISEVIQGYTYFEEGDVLLAKITPCLENGKAAVVQNLPHRIGFGSTEFHVLRPKEGLDARYLFYMIWNPLFRHEASRNMTGSAGQKRVPTDFLNRFKIPLPSLSDQHRIVSILDKADAIRHQRDEGIRLTEELLHSTFLEIFGDPTTNPKGWERVSLGNVTTLVTSGLTPKGGSTVYVNEGPIFIRSQNVLMNRLNLSDVAHLPICIHESMSRTKVAINDVLLNITGASIGRVTWVQELPGEANVNQHVCIIRLDQRKATSEFVSIFLSLPFGQRQIDNLQSGASRQGLNHQQVRSLHMPLPPLRLQQRFSNVVSKLRTITAEREKAYAASEQLFSSLVQRAFRGEL